MMGWCCGVIVCGGVLYDDDDVQVSINANDDWW